MKLFLSFQKNPNCVIFQAYFSKTSLVVVIFYLDYRLIIAICKIIEITCILHYCRYIYIYKYVMIAIVFIYREMKATILLKYI